jgi:hypothetical protein
VGAVGIETGQMAGCAVSESVAGTDGLHVVNFSNDEVQALSSDDFF